MLPPENTPSFVVTAQKAGSNLLAGGLAFTVVEQVQAWAAKQLDCEPGDIEVNIVEGYADEPLNWQALYDDGVAGA